MGSIAKVRVYFVFMYSRVAAQATSYKHRTLLSPQVMARYTRATRIWSSRYQLNVFAPNGTNQSASTVFTTKVEFNV